MAGEKPRTNLRWKPCPKCGARVGRARDQSLIWTDFEKSLVLLEPNPEKTVEINGYDVARDGYELCHVRKTYRIHRCTGKKA